MLLRKIFSIFQILLFCLTATLLFSSCGEEKEKSDPKNLDGSKTTAKASATSAQIVDEELKVSIINDIEKYAVIMSSTVGIGLSASLTGETDKEIIYQWSCNVGLFVGWGEPDFKVNKLGKTTENDGTKLFWSYRPEDEKDTPVNVIIKLSAIEKSTKKLLAESELKILLEKGMGGATVIK